MTIKRMAIVDNEGLVVNVIELDTDSDYQAPDGCVLVEDTPIGDDTQSALPGDSMWDGDQFIPLTVPGIEA